MRRPGVAARPSLLFSTTRECCESESPGELSASLRQAARARSATRDTARAQKCKRVACASPRRAHVTRLHARHHFTCSLRCTNHLRVKSRSRGATLGVAALYAVCALAWTPRAAAYCRTMSCELGEDPRHPTCPRDESQCVTQGNPLHWASPCLTYSVQVDGSPRSNLDADQVQAFVEQAFSAWKAARCPGGGSPRFEVQFQSYVSCDRREAVCDNLAKDANVVMFHDSNWHDGVGHIGVTTPTGGKESGLVIDADVEINSQDYSFASDHSGTMSTSLMYVLTHELGHFLGLAHSQVIGSVMRPTNYQSLPYSPNLISADDVAAICAAYPPGPKLSCEPPRASTYDACAIPLGEDPPCKLSSLTQDGGGCGCRLADSSTHPASPTLAALGLLLAALVRRRLKSRDAQSAQ